MNVELDLPGYPSINVIGNCAHPECANDSAGTTVQIQQDDQIVILPVGSVRAFMLALDTVTTYPSTAGVIVLEPDDDWDKWTVTGDIRLSDGDDFNYECADHLTPMFPDVEFDCESSCFYAYCDDADTASRVKDAVGAWLKNKSLDNHYLGR